MTFLINLPLVALGGEPHAVSIVGRLHQAADAVGEVKYVEGADLDLDVGCLTELMAERNGPMLVFDKFPAYPAGYRIASNFVRSVRRFALALDLPLDVHPLELLRLWHESARAPRQSRP